MKRYLLKRLPERRPELGWITLFYLGLWMAVWFVHRHTTGTVLALTILELLLPLGVSFIAAGLLAGDPSLDLLMSAPRPASFTLMERLVVVLGWGGLLGLSAQGFIALCNVSLPIEGLSRVLIWVAPMMFLTGLATLGALVRGRILGGLIASLGGLGWALFTAPYIISACGLTLSDRCMATLISPVITLLRPMSPYWHLNRFIWSAVGFLLLAVGLALAGREERLTEALRAGEDA